MAKKKADFVSDAAVETYIRDVLKIRASSAGVKEFSQRFNGVMAVVLKESAKLTKKAKRKTILPKAIVAAFEKHVGKETLDWDEVTEHLIKLPAADLGKVSQAITQRLKSLGS